MISQNIIVCGRKVNLGKVSKKKEKAYRDFLRDILKVHEKSERKRSVIGISGRSGSGKSTVATILKKISNGKIVHVSIDAFHYPNRTLRKKKLIERKGRYDTYDVKLLEKKLKQFREGKKVKFPVYSRAKHEPIKDKIVIKDDKILVLEGNWLLFRTWSKVAKNIDYNFYLQSNAKRARKAAIERHVKGGRSEQNAREFFDNSDGKNNILIEKTKKKADKLVKSVN